MTRFVVDASVAVKWLVFEELSDQAEAFARSRNYLIAPRIILTEVANALVRKVARGEVAESEVLNDYSKLPLFFDEIIAVEDMIPRAIENACRVRHPVYDLIYLEVALREGAKLITSDRRLLMKVGGTHLADQLVLLSDWRPV